jgi:hypothetical protein
LTARVIFPGQAPTSTIAWSTTKLREQNKYWFEPVHRREEVITEKLKEKAGRSRTMTWQASPRKI